MKNELGAICKTAIWIVVLSFALSPSINAQVVINEIFYHAPDDLDLEYVELLNAGDVEVDLSEWKLAGGIKYEFPAGMKLKAGGFAVVASNSELVNEFYKIEAIGEFKKSLSNSGDKVKLLTNEGRLVEEVSYRDRDPWPVSADGYSGSLERVYAKGKSNLVSNWAPSELSSDYDSKPAGSPGRANSVAADALPPSISQVKWEPEQPKPGSELLVTANIEQADSIESVLLHYRRMEPGKAGEEQTVAMARSDDGSFNAKIPTGPEQNRIVSFWVVAKSKSGGVASHPRMNDIRPSHSVYVNDAVSADKIPVLQFFHLAEKAFKAGESYREQQREMSRGYGGRGGRGFGGFGRGEVR